MIKLESLEAIDNANPSEALKCLDYLHNSKMFKYVGDEEHFIEQYHTIKQALIKAQKQDKILEILKKAYTNHIWSLYADTYELASSGFYRKIEITQEQSHLFEEWLNGR